VPSAPGPKWRPRREEKSWLMGGGILSLFFFFNTNDWDSFHQMFLFLN
jgi:hypothetical protein